MAIAIGGKTIRMAIAIGGKTIRMAIAIGGKTIRMAIAIGVYTVTGVFELRRHLDTYRWHRQNNIKYNK